MRRLILPVCLVLLLAWVPDALKAQTGGKGTPGEAVGFQGEAWDSQEAFRRAQLLVSSGKLKEGLDLFLELREKAPRYRPLAVQRYICRLYEKTGDIAQALREYEVFIKRYPWARDRVQMLMRMAAMAEVALHDLNRAWRYLEMVPEDRVPPGDMAPYLFNKAYLLEKMGRKEEALEYYRRLAEEYPQTVGGFWAKERLKKLGGSLEGSPQANSPMEGKQ